MEEIVFPNQLRMLRRVRGRRMTEIANWIRKRRSHGGNRVPKSVKNVAPCAW